MRVAVSPLPQYAFMVWCSVKNHRDNSAFNFYCSYKQYPLKFIVATQDSKQEMQYVIRMYISRG